jgi:hypothetical protein
MAATRRRRQISNSRAYGIVRDDDIRLNALLGDHRVQGLTEEMVRFIGGYDDTDLIGHRVDGNLGCRAGVRQAELAPRAIGEIMKQATRVTFVLVVTLALAACAAGSPQSVQATGGGPIALLALGIWHGIIAPITLIVEILNRFAPGLVPVRWHMYETGASSALYDLGFYFGLAGGPSFLFFRRG